MAFSKQSLPFIYCGLLREICTCD